MCSSIDAGPRTFPVLFLRRTRGCLSSQKCNSRAKADKVGGIDSSAATRRCASAKIASLSDGRPPVGEIGAAGAAPAGRSDCLRSNSRSAMLISRSDQRPRLVSMRTSPSITASFHAAGETDSGARLREMIPGRLPGRRSMLTGPLSLSSNSESADDGTLERMLPATHASISHACARPTLVFWAVLIISTAFEMAHHVLAVISSVCRTLGTPRHFSMRFGQKCGRSRRHKTKKPRTGRGEFDGMEGAN
jgi:hypothetical protein